MANVNRIWYSKNVYTMGQSAAKRLYEMKVHRL